MSFGQGDQVRTSYIKLWTTQTRWPMQGLTTAFQMIRPKKVEFFMTGIQANDGTNNPDSYNIQVLMA